MSVERIDGIKYHLDHEPIEVIETILSHRLKDHAQTTRDIEVLEAELHRRRNTELPLEPSVVNYERILGHAVMSGEIDATEAYRALEQYEQ